VPYPPDHHMLRDLALQLQRGVEIGDRIVLPAPAETRGPLGWTRPGILATAVDVVAASVALRSLSPDWLATSDISVRTLEQRQTGPIFGSARRLRSGRTTAVIEVDLRDEATAAPVATSIVTFVRIARPDDTEAAPVELPSETETLEFGTPGADQAPPLLQTAGISTLDGEQGIVELHKSSYCGNSFGSLQGGMVALLIELAGESAASHANTATCAAIDVAVHYLAPGTVGPYRTRAEHLRRVGATDLYRVELEDTGNRRLMAVGTVTTACPR